MSIKDKTVQFKKGFYVSSCSLTNNLCSSQRTRKMNKRQENYYIIRGRNSNAHQMFHLLSSISQPLYSMWAHVTSFGQWNGSKSDLQTEAINSLCIIFQPFFFPNWGSYVFHMEHLQVGGVLVSLGPWMEQRLLLTCDRHVGWARNKSSLC